MTDERYPLWCVDKGEDHGEQRYLGPFETEAKAKNSRLRDRDEDDESPEPVVRRCRRARPAELGVDIMALINEHIFEELEDDTIYPVTAYEVPE